ncbi:MAG: hypothetical protein ACRENA_05380 [Vulcanimicrobiaceae bacterium]
MRQSSIAMAACVGAFVIASLPVLAQIAPNDTGAGIRRGMQDMNFSGQVGSVTLYNRSSGTGTLVVIDVQGQPSGKIESASIQRGKDCNNVDPNPVWKLNDVTNGRSATPVSAAETKLLSGNYVVIVHAGNAEMSGGMHGKAAPQSSKARWQPALCGHLYPGS